MRPKSIILLTLALGCGLIASIGINQVMANRRAAPAQPAGETTPVFVAVAEIGIGDPLTPQALKLEPWPKEKAPAGALGKLEEIEGRRSRSKFYPGEPILEAKLLPKGENGASAIDMIPNGMRVVPIRVDAVSGASGMILPGDRVDMLVHLREDAAHGVARAVTRTFLQNIKVFAADDVYDRPGVDNKSMTAKTISVLVTPEQAELVGLATQMGTVQLVMRNANDDSAENPGGADLQKLLLGHTDVDGASEPRAFMEAFKLKPATPPPAAPPAPVAAVEPDQDMFTMVILDGGKPREVVFKRGKPANVADTAPPEVESHATDENPVIVPAPNGDKPKESDEQENSQDYSGTD